MEFSMLDKASSSQYSFNGNNGCLVNTFKNYKYFIIANACKSVQIHSMFLLKHDLT